MNDPNRPEYNEIEEALRSFQIDPADWFALGPLEKAEVIAAIEELISEGFSETYENLSAKIWDEEPPDIRTILDDPYYFGDIGGRDLYPILKDHMIEIFTSPWILEVILTGSIGWGKSYFAAVGMAIEVLRLLHLKDPQSFCGAAVGTKISIVNMSVTAANAESVLFGKVFEILSRCPWIRDNFPINERTGIYFPEKNIEFRPGSSSEMAVIGEDLIGAALDEANFMVGARRSKRAILAGEFDVAKIIYDAIARRRISRFVGVLSGKVVAPAHMWLISSKQFPGDFLEQKINAIHEQARNGENIHTKILDFPQWETRMSLPPAKNPYSGKWFAIFLGDAMHESRIVDRDREFDSEKAAVDSYDATIEDGCKVIGVPVEYKGAFVEDLYGAIRDFAGHAVLASKPFFSDTQAFSDMLCNQEIGDVDRVHPYRFVQHDLVSPDLFDHENVLITYNDNGRPQPLLNPNQRRFAHFDLAVSEDSAGFAICHFGGWKAKKLRVLDRSRNDQGTLIEKFVEVLEHRPIVIVDFMMRINPPVGGRIDLDSMRSLLYTFERLAGVIGFHKITFDQFQSETQIAALKAEGYKAERFSVDRNDGAYGYLRSAISDRRFSTYDYPPFVEDLSSIERNHKGKVDHRQGGSKDVSDCVAACCWHIEEKFQRHRVPLIPDAGTDRRGLSREDQFLKQAAPGTLTTEERIEFDPFSAHNLIGDIDVW